MTCVFNQLSASSWISTSDLLKSRYGEEIFLKSSVIRVFAAFCAAKKTKHSPFVSEYLAALLYIGCSRLGNRIAVGCLISPEAQPTDAFHFARSIRVLSARDCAAECAPSRFLGLCFCCVRRQKTSSTGRQHAFAANRDFVTRFFLLLRGRRGEVEGPDGALSATLGHCNVQIDSACFAIVEIACTSGAK